ncbi:hypothetical protein Q9L58_010438 [Maublancomyces gigas]|uniref:Uncharacterized protein n=1 Tax=Discina gigas TaxID=1032678 RepID=A0ABR3G437_9PEZI
MIDDKIQPTPSPTPSAPEPSVPGGTLATADPNTFDPEPSQVEEPRVFGDIPTGEPESNEDMKEPAKEESELTFSPDYTTDFYPLVDYAQGADPTVQYILWAIRSDHSHISARLEQADMAVIALQKFVANQSSANATLNTEICKRSNTPLSSPPAPTTPSLKKENIAPATKEKGKGKQSCVNITKNNTDTGFTTVRKKNKPTQLFAPEYTRINSVVNVATDGPLPEFITDDNILDNINKKTVTRNLRFRSAHRSPSGEIVLQTNVTASASHGAALALVIAAALDIITIDVRSIKANSRWTCFVVQGIPAHIGTYNTTETCARMAEEITNQPILSWPSRPDGLPPKQS